MSTPKSRAVGRKSIDFYPTPEVLERLEELTRQGYTLKSIALAEFNVSHTTFAKWREKYPEMDEAINRGLVRDEQLCFNELRSMAFNPDFKQRLGALMSYGKLKFRWNDGTRRDVGIKQDSDLPEQEIDFINFDQAKPQD